MRVAALVAGVIAAAIGLPAPADAQTVRGRVVQRDADTPIADAQLQLVDGGGRILEDARSDSAGWFVLESRGLRNGLRIIARRIGFYAAVVDLPALAPDVRTDLLVSMQRLALDTVRVSSSASKSRTLGLHPNSLAIKPITRDIIERELARATDLGSLLRWRQIPGVLVQPGCVRIHMAHCALLVIDGLPQRDWTVRIADVEEILVLTGNEANVLFGAKGESGAIVVYTITGATRR